MSTIVVLNASYEPHARVDFKHAVKMLFREVAVVEEPDGSKMIGPHPWPRVIRLLRYVKTGWMHAPARYSRAAVLRRDQHKCAYCGKHATTIDHVQPLSKGGDSSFFNCISACKSCNGKKGNKTLAEAHMKLLFEPYHPTRAQLAAIEV